jgi:hypothetical protein
MASINEEDVIASSMGVSLTAHETHSGGPFVGKETGPEEVAEVICRYSILLISSSDLHSSNSSVVY